MNRRLARSWARWLLPLLVARAFLPVGFMLAASVDGLQLSLCRAQAPVGLLGAATALDHAAHGAGSGHGEHDERGGHLDPPCPFAIGAVAAALAVPQADPAVRRTLERIVPERTVSIPVAGPHRSDRIRGPPSLS